MVERRLSNRELDAELSKVKFRSEEKQRIFQRISNQVWFRQYGRGSKDALAKITKKVKQGINKGKYNTSPSVKDVEPPTGFEKPKKQKVKQAKGKKKLDKQTKKLLKKMDNTVKDAKTVVKNSKRRTKIENRTGEKSPSGREYSKTELREGKGSKRAKAWRVRNGIDENDYD